jgi:hypothetical protein
MPVISGVQDETLKQSLEGCLIVPYELIVRRSTGAV